MFDFSDEIPEWVPPPGRWFPGPNPDLLELPEEDPYSPDPYSYF
jgi:hypothetical protein